MFCKEKSWAAWLFFLLDAPYTKSMTLLFVRFAVWNLQSLCLLSLLCDVSAFFPGRCPFS
jgi:hypothetical protein